MGVAENMSERQAVERGFGVRLYDFVRLTVGKTSVNFKATALDGRRYFVKFARKRALEKAQLVDARVRSPLIGKMAFGGRSFPYGEWMCFAFDWIDGARSVRPQDLTSRQVRSLAEAYAQMSDALRDADVGDGSGRPIHGDLHYDNIFFRGDEVVAFFDFEMLRRGLPTEDLVRIFSHCLERTRFWRVITIRRIYSAFRELVRASRYSPADWIEAIDRSECGKRVSRLRKRNRSAVAHVENFLVSWIYRGLRNCVKSQSGDRVVLERK